MSILGIINITDGGTAVVAVVLCQAVPVLLLQLHTEVQPRDTSSTTTTQGFNASGILTAWDLLYQGGHLGA